jgi:hypothetical protein
MVGVGGHAQEYGEAIVGFRLKRGGVGFGEICGGLFADGGRDHGDGAVEIDENLFLGEPARLVEFAVAVTHVGGAGDLRADVVIQIAGEMQEQVADAITVRIGLLPELIGRKGRDPLMQAEANFFVVSGERRSDELAEVWHGPAGAAARRAACAILNHRFRTFKFQLSVHAVGAGACCARNMVKNSTVVEPFNADAGWNSRMEWRAGCLSPIGCEYRGVRLHETFGR